MWNERQRAQKIDVELERIKRDLREQDRELEDLTDACGAEDGDEKPTTRQANPALLNNTFVLRG